MTTTTKPTRVRRGSTINKQLRVRLDPNSLARIELVRTLVEIDMGQRLSDSMVVRLALHMLAKLMQKTVAIGSLAGQVKASAEGR
jgi:hypothetical protein